MLGDVRSILSLNKKCCNHASLHESNYKKYNKNPNVEDTSLFKIVKTKHALLCVRLH